MAPKTFWRKDHGAVVKYHIRDYRVPWSEQLLAAIALARKHGEQLYLEDTPETVYARNRGNVKPVELSEAELSVIASFDMAFDTASCVIICPVMMLDEHSGEVVPVKSTLFPFGVTTKHRTEQGDEFSLWYPEVETDQHGLICLPVYREMIADPALVAVDANGTRIIVETFGLRDIAKPYRFGMYVPIVLSGEQHSQLTCLPGLEEEFRYAKRQVFAKLSLDNTAVLGELGIVFKHPYQFQVEEDGIIMPTLCYADEFAGLHFRGLTRTELTRQLRKYRDEYTVSSRGQAPALTLPPASTLMTVTNGDNFIVSRNNGRTYLCRFFANNDPQQTGVLDVWDLGWIRFNQSTTRKLVPNGTLAYASYSD